MQPTLFTYDKHLDVQRSGFLTSCIPLKAEHLNQLPIFSVLSAFLFVVDANPHLCACVNLVSVCLFVCLVSLGQAILVWLPAVLSVILASIDIQTEQLRLFMFFN